MLLHGAGLEISRFLKDKEPREFDLVFDVKADGWFNVLKGLGDVPLGATVAFSSIAGRFGNGGQTDYSVGQRPPVQDDLRACATRAPARGASPSTGRPGPTSAWPARGSIPAMMERAGIDMLPAARGIPVIRRELTAGGTRGRDRDRGPPRRPRAGVGRDGRPRSGGSRGGGGGPHGGLRPRASACTTGWRSRPSSTPGQQPFLNDHRIDGTPVLPGVMGIESFAEAAALVLPGFHVVSVENDRLPRPLQVLPGRAARRSASTRSSARTAARS